MNLSHDSALTVPTRAVLDVLTHADTLAAALGVPPGDGPDMPLTLSFGSLEIAYLVQAGAVEIDHAAGRLVAALSAREQRGAGTAGATVTLRLRESDGATQVASEVELTGGGALADAEPAEVEAAVRMLLDRLGAALEARFGTAAAASAPTIDAPGGYGVPWPTVPAPDPVDEPSEGEDEAAEESAWEPSAEDMRELADLVAEIEREEAEQRAAGAVPDHPEAERPPAVSGDWPRRPADGDAPAATAVAPPQEPAPPLPPGSLWPPAAELAPEATGEPPAAPAVVPPSAPARQEGGATRPERPRPATPISGAVHVVTDGPLDGSRIPVGDGPVALLRSLTRRHPWVVPAAVVGGVALVLVLRRRRPLAAA